MFSQGIPPQVWAAATAALVYGSLWAVLPTILFEGVERSGASSRTQFRIGLLLQSSNLVVLALVAVLALRHPLMGQTAVALFAAPAAWLSLALPRAEWVLFPMWTFGALFATARQVIAVGVVRRLLRGSTVDAQLDRRVAALATRANLTPPPCRVSPALRAPVLAGTVRPTLLAPSTRPDDLTDAQFDAVLAHELGHYANADALTGLVISLVGVVYFFHPAVWRLNARLRHLRECAADDFAAALTDHRALASGLAQYACAPSPLAALTSTGGHLMDRIRRLIGGRAERRAPVLLLLTGLLAGCAAVVADVSVGGPDHRAQMRQSEQIGRDYAQLRGAVVTDPTPEQIAQLRIDAARGDLVARFGLLSGLGLLGLDGDEEARDEAYALMLTLIAEHPAAFNAFPLPGVALTKDYDGVLAAWDEQVVLHPTDPTVLGAAAYAYMVADTDHAIALLELAHMLDPFTHDWKSRLARLLAERGDIDGVERALDPGLSAGLVHEDPDEADYEGWMDWDSKLQAAINAEEWDDVVHYAEGYLADAEHHTGDWNYGNALHEANTGLGLAALAAGDDQAAIAYLAAAGACGGSPQLSSFGPDSKLADAVSRRGHSEAAAAWVEAVGMYWETEDDCSQEYVRLRAAAVRAGEPVGEEAFGFWATDALLPDCE